MITIDTGDNRKYRVYTALLSQAGTNAPVATVLENTFGIDPVWTRSEAGVYDCTLNNAFTANKTTCMTALNLGGVGDNLNFPISRQSASIIHLESGVMGDVPIDNALQGVLVEIRVYQ